MILNIHNSATVFTHRPQGTVCWSGVVFILLLQEISIMVVLMFVTTFSMTVLAVMIVPMAGGVMLLTA